MLLMLMAVLTGATAEPAPHFTAGCLAERSAAYCACVTTTLAADPDGRFFLDMFELTALPDADQANAYAALLARYGFDPAGASARRVRGQAVGDAAVEACT